MIQQYHHRKVSKYFYPFLKVYFTFCYNMYNVYLQLTDRKTDNSCQNVDAMKMPLHVEVENLYTHLNER